MPVSRHADALAAYHNRNIRAGRSISCAAHRLGLEYPAKISVESSHIWKLDSEESGRAGIPISAAIPRQHINFSLL